jgi:peptide deformylase
MGQRKYETTSGVPAPVVGDGAAPSKSGTHKRLLVRQVLEHPHPVLARPSVEIDPCSAAVVALANLLVATMRSLPGCIGLSAPQIGENVRLFAIDVRGHVKAHSCAGLVVLANPRIITRAGNVVMREGCASVPHLTGYVARASEIIVSAAVPGTGKNVLITSNAIEARCVQHEVDHLDGVLFVDRVRDPVTDLFPRKTYT